MIIYTIQKTPSREGVLFLEIVYLGADNVFFPQVSLFKVEDAIAHSFGEGAVVGHDDHAHAFGF